MLSRACSLTPSECRVLIRLSDGSQFKEIAADLGVSVNTAKTWGQRAYRKLRVDNRRDAVIRHRRLQEHPCYRPVLS